LLIPLQMKHISYLFFLNLIIIGCSQKTTSISEPLRKESEIPIGEVSEGNSLYQAHCGTCHKLPVVSKYSAEKWKKVLPPMVKEAKLDANQERKITAFVNWKLQHP
jgi:hypothetical protein